MHAARSRLGAPRQTTLLHVDAEATRALAGDGALPDEQRARAIGSARTAGAFFGPDAPAPAELGQAACARRAARGGAARGQTSQSGRSRRMAPSSSITTPLTSFRRRPARSLSLPLPSAITAMKTISASSAM